MSRHPSSAAIQEAQSLLLKTLGCESEAKRKRRGMPEPKVSEEDARPLATTRGRTLLHQVSRRVDKLLRGRKDQADALLSVIRLGKLGVMPGHLPVLPSARTLYRICKRGRVTSRAEAALVESVLRNTELVCQLGTHAQALGNALDAWQRHS